MVDKLVGLITGALAGKLGKAGICFVISLFPILELRGGLLAASPAFLDVPLTTAVPVCIIGNLLPIPFVLLLIERILILMEKISFTSGIAGWLRRKAEKNQDQIVKYGFWGLVLFVGIPLPGTGAWTGSLVAALLHMPFKKAFTACILGVLMACVIMCIVSYGVLGTLFG
ncbi:MAG: small multi-drug export protein [Eubacteriales bacterium]|nr:small multi-drug export protein [Eubacteriales bacterium]